MIVGLAPDFPQPLQSLKCLKSKNNYSTNVVNGKIDNTDRKIIARPCMGSNDKMLAALQ
jgi:hypothetical protein